MILALGPGLKYYNVEKKTQEEKKPVRTLLGFQVEKEDDNEEDSKGEVLHDGSRLLSFKMMPNGQKLEKVTIVGQAPDGPLSVTIPIKTEDYLTGGKFVHQMAARRRIQDLEENSELNSTQEEEITNLGLKYGLATKFTSFIGVDKKTRKSPFEGALIKHQIRQEVPFGLCQQQRPLMRMRQQPISGFSFASSPIPGSCFQRGASRAFASKCSDSPPTGSLFGASRSRNSGSFGSTPVAFGASSTNSGLFGSITNTFGSIGVTNGSSNNAFGSRSNSGFASQAEVKSVLGPFGAGQSSKLNNIPVSYTPPGSGFSAVGACSTLR